MRGRQWQREAETSRAYKEAGDWILFIEGIRPILSPNRPGTPPDSFPARAKNSLRGQKEFPAFGGAGNWLQRIESA
jgi:hypothetical protein